MPDHRPPAGRLLARRDLLGAVAVLGVVGVTGLAGGCQDQRTAQPTGARSSSGSASPSPDQPPAGGTADERLVARARTEIAAVAALVTATSTQRPRLAAELAPWTSLHRQHLDALQDVGTPGAAPSPGVAVPPGPQAARRQVLGQERRLGDSLAALALRAQSGALARLLAGMSAATTQRLTVAGG